MFLLTIFVLSSLYSIISASDYVLILDHKDVANGYFSSDLKNDGLENENDATANTYSIIGNFNDDAALQSQYRDSDGKFAFKLIYRYDDGTNDTLIWRQSSWIADANVTGADLSEIPDQSGKEAAAQFYGLALSTYSATYIDGTGGEYEWWFHSVGSNTAWGGGIPGDRRYEAAYSSSLYLLNPTCGGCDDDLVCIGGECQRDCDVLDIDGFLTDCSDEFSSNEAEIAALQELVSLIIDAGKTNSEDIDSLTTDVNGLIEAGVIVEKQIIALQNNVTTIEEDAVIAAGYLENLVLEVASLEERVERGEKNISDISSDIEYIKMVLDKLDAKSPGSNFDNNHVDNNHVDYNRKLPSSGTNVQLISLENKDIFIMVLLISNLALMIGGCVICSLWMNSKGKYGKYDKVRGYYTDENM